MNKFLKKILIVALALISALSLVACGDAETTKNDEKGLFCKKIGGIYTIYKYVDNGEDKLDIAQALAGLEIDDTNIRIQSQAFNGNGSLKEIIVPDSVTKIEKGAFAGMKALEKLTIPFVGMNANGDASIGETLASPDKAVDAERTIAYIFGDSEYDEGILQTINYGTGSSTGSDGSTTTQSTTCYLPITLNTITVAGNKIPACAFNGLTKAVKIVLNDSVEVIGDYAFANTAQIDEIKLPANLKKIGKGAFNKAVSLEKINLNELTALTEIGEATFEETALTAVITPSSLEIIAKNAFKNCQELTSLTLNNGLKTIGSYAFMGCESLSVIDTTTNSVQAGSIDLGNYAFANCEDLEATAYDVAVYKTLGVNAFNK